MKTPGDDVDPEGFAHVWEGLPHPSNNIEGYPFRIHWSSSDKTLKLVIHSKLHDFLLHHGFFSIVTRVDMQGWISHVCAGTVDINPAPALLLDTLYP
ncbi:hypothetical protein C7212DRAFT_337458, partial [Tuber magnatum]